MADLSDVENALVAIIADAIYQDGPDYVQNTGIISTLGFAVRLSRGWPLNDALNNDLAANISNVTIFSMPGMARNTTRYEWQWRQSSTVPVTLCVNINDNVVTFYGVGSVGQVAGLSYGTTGYVRRLTASDTPQSVAQFIGVQIPGATVSGSSITLPTTLPLTCRILGDATGGIETRRQIQTFRISCWCPSPDTRDILCSTIDNAMALVRAIELPDGTLTDVPKYAGTHVDDAPEKAALWRRDLMYGIEYPTILSETLPRALFINTVIHTQYCDDDETIV